MAAAIIPLITALAPEIINLITGLIHKHAPEAEQTSGPQTGPVKFADVFVAVMKDLTNAKVAGTIPTLPDDPTVKVIIQAVVTSMKISGVLDATAVPQVTAMQAPALKPGQFITIKLEGPGT